MKKWNRSLGTSKREQGVLTPKAPRFKKFKNGKLKCHCLFRGKELWQECRQHILLKQEEAFFKEMLARIKAEEKENDKKTDKK